VQRPRGGSSSRALSCGSARAMSSAASDASPPAKKPPPGLALAPLGAGEDGGGGGPLPEPPPSRGPGPGAAGPLRSSGAGAACSGVAEEGRGCSHVYGSIGIRRRPAEGGSARSGRRSEAASGVFTGRGASWRRGRSRSTAVGSRRLGAGSGLPVPGLAVSAVGVGAGEEATAGGAASFGAELCCSGAADSAPVRDSDAVREDSLPAPPGGDRVTRSTGGGGGGSEGVDTGSGGAGGGGGAGACSGSTVGAAGPVPAVPPEESAPADNVSAPPAAESVGPAAAPTAADPPDGTATASVGSSARATAHGRASAAVAARAAARRDGRFMASGVNSLTTWVLRSHQFGEICAFGDYAPKRGCVRGVAIKGTKRSPCWPTRSSTSPISKASAAAAPRSRARSTSFHCTGVETVGRRFARTE
jgi:hypothetical protein